MKGLAAALWAETLKARRSKMFPVTIAVFAAIALMMGLLEFAVRHPEIAGRSAMVNAKSSAIGNADWPSFLGLLIQVVLSVGTMGFGIVTAWIFGREYSDRTVKDLLALPVSRASIIISKFIIALLWCILLSLILFTVGIVTGLAVHLPGWSGQAAAHAFGIFLSGAVLTIFLCTPVAFVAGCGRGYLLPIGFSIFTLVITQLVFLGMADMTVYFPWALPALASGLAGQAAPAPTTISYLIFGATCIAGLWGTLWWWRSADQM